MFWFSKIVAPAVLVAAIAGSAAVLAQPGSGQPPFQPGKGKGNPFNRGGDDKKGGDDKRGSSGAKSDATVEGWIKTLTDKMNDPHDTIRDSARAALVAVGEPAIPALKKLAEGNDEAKAVAARKLIAQIERGQPGRGGAGAFPGFPGRPGGARPMEPGRPGARPMERGGDPFGRLLGDLQLTEKQQKELRELMEGQAKKMREFAEKARDGKIERKELPEAMEKFQKELTEQLKKVLNEEQFKKFQERGPGRFPFPGVPFGPGGFGGERPGKPKGDKDR